jgi:ATP-dependent DNA ligase
LRSVEAGHLFSKNGKDFSRKFPQVSAALKDALPLGTVVDGELVAFDESGHCAACVVITCLPTSFKGGFHSN